jgi:hypothetical protein
MHLENRIIDMDKNQEKIYVVIFGVYFKAFFSWFVEGFEMNEIPSYKILS